MKKLLLLSTVCFYSACTIAQRFPVKSPYSSPTAIRINYGAEQFDKGIVLPNFADTSALNLLPYLKNEPFLTVSLSGGVLVQRNNTATRWIFIGGTANSYCARPIISGGIVTWVSGLTFDNTTAVICVSDKQYIASQGSVTLVTANPSLPRQDLIVADTFGLTYSISGIPAANPAEPSYNPSYQVPLVSVNIAAGATVPTGVSSVIIWNENTGSPEYTGLSTGVGRTVNFNNTTSPYNGSKSTNAGSFAVGFSHVITYSGAAYNKSQFNALKFFIQLKGLLMSGNIYVTLMSGGLPITSPLLLGGADGFSKTNISSYQNITKPFTDFSFISSALNIDGIRFTTTGLSSQGFYLDYITLNGGLPTGGGGTTSTTAITNIFRKAGTDSVFKVINGLTIYAYKDSIGAGGGAYTGQSPIVVAGTVISADTSKTSGKLATYNDVITKYSSIAQGSDSTYFVLVKPNGQRDTVYFSGGGSAIPDSLIKDVIAINDSLLRFTRYDGTVKDVSVLGKANNAGGGSGLDSTTASEGLTLVGKDVQLGGIITNSKTIDGSGANAGEFITMSNIYGVDFKSGKYTGSTFKTEHQFTLDPFQSNWSNRSWSLSNVPFEKARVTLSSQPDAFIDLSIDSGGVSEIATIQLSRNNIKLKASGLSTIYPKTYSGGGIERTLPISVNGNYAGTNGNITIAGGGSGLDTTKIPLSGTVAGKPVTGNIRTTAITAIVSNGADMAIGIDESLNLEDIQNGAMVYFEKKLNNIASLWARKNDTIVKVSAISDGHNSRLIVDANNSTSRGISGALDYTPNITNVDYTQKIYVDRKADSLAKTLTRVGDSIRLISKGGIVLSTVNAPIGGGGGVTVTSYGKNATKDSTILLLSNGIRYAAKDSIGTGGGGTDTTYIVAGYGVKIDSLLREYTISVDSLIVANKAYVNNKDALNVKYTDTTLMLAPYLRNATAAATYATINNLNLKANQSALVDTAFALRSLSGAKPDTGSLVKITLSGLRDNDLLKYDSVNNRFINFRLNVNAPLVWNRSTNTLSADTTTAITGLATKANVAAGGGGGSTDTTSLSNRINQRWSLLGNLGTNSGSNFFGTTDTAKISIRWNNTYYGQIGGVGYNITMGAFWPNITGSQNTNYGIFGLQALTSGSNNTNGGQDGLIALLSGSSNTNFGAGGQTTNTTANFMSSFGKGVFAANNANGGTGMGYLAGAANTGGFNCLYGLNAAASSGNGAFISAFGTNALFTNGNANNGSAFGAYSLYSNSTGASNAAFGYYAGFYNSTVANQYFLNNQDRGSYAGDQNFSLVYGKFATDMLSQSLTVNGKLGINNNTPTSYLQLTPGSSAANTSPLKFTANSLTTTAAIGNGSGVTITFATQAFIIPVGSTITVAGVTPSGYNGTFIVTASTATTVSYTNATTGAQTVAGTVTTGHLLTTPENGSMEFDGANYWVTTNGVRALLTRTLTGTAAPATTPTAVGMQYVDTINKKLYVATGTASSADWTILN